MRAALLVLVALVAGFAGELAPAQHCGGPCEVPRGADPVAPNPRFTLSEGIETANWRYLFNWFWTVDGVQEHRVESALRAPPLSDFGFRRMFVSPAGNGFLVTGNPYARPGRLGGREPPLFVFCDPKGERLAVVSLPHALSRAGEKVQDACPGCDCEDVLYVFAQDPSVSENGCFVELVARGSNRRLGVFLPWGCFVRDRREFEEALERAEWSRLSDDAAARAKGEIAGLLDELGSDELSVRERAADALAAKGFLALGAVREARERSESGNFRARARAVEARLLPLGAAGWEAISIDLELLGSFLTYADPDVVAAVEQRLALLLPETEGLEPEASANWIQTHRDELNWNETKGRYELRSPRGASW